MYHFLKALKCVLLLAFLLSGVASIGQKPSKPWWSFPSNQKSGQVLGIEDFDLIAKDSNYVVFETHYSKEEKNDSLMDYFNFWTFSADSTETFDIDLFLKNDKSFDLYVTVMNESGDLVIYPNESTLNLYKVKETNQYIIDWRFSPPLDQFYDPALEKRYFFKLKVPD